MKVPFGNLQAQYHAYKEAIDQSVARVLERGYFVLGPELERFEKEFAPVAGTEYAAGCASGTDAIYLALAACNVGPGDEVLVVAHTAVPTICAIRQTGATPVFVDIEPSTYTMDPVDLKKKVTPKSKAIVPVHLYGQMADMDAITSIAAEHNLTVIEDCAQSVASTYKGKKAGSIGEFGAFSFYPSKNLGAFGDGGAVSVKDQEGFDLLVKLRNYGQSKRYYHDIEGVNSRLDEIQAAILTAQMPHLEELTERRREIAARYTEGLKHVVRTPYEAPDRRHVYHLYVIETSHREKLMEYLLSKSVQALIHYPVPAHLQQAYAFLGKKEGYLPATEYATKRIVSLPMFPQLTDEQIDLVIESICEFYKDNQLEAESHVMETKANADEKPYEVASSAQAR